MPFFPPLLNEPTYTRLIESAHKKFLQSIIDEMHYNLSPVYYHIKNNDISNNCEAFLHLTTKDNIAKTERVFDADRTKRIHWITPLLNNFSNEKVFIYEKIYGNSVRIHIFVPSRYYILILEPEKSHGNCYYIVTAFNLDNPNRVGYHMKQYRKYTRNGCKPF